MLTEGSEMNDLARLVKPELTIDEFRSKMGEDKDIIVLGFTVLTKEPAADLVNFIEKSYDWVLDADISSGETSDGNYVVFVEVQRKPTAAKHIMTMLTDILNLTDQKIDETFSYYKGDKKLPITLANLQDKIIGSPEEYELKTGDSLEESIRLNSLRALAGVTVQPKKITDSLLYNMQIMAGIKWISQKNNL